MRYILDDRGYVKYCSNTYITCENKTCTPYEGNIPDGYETVEEWVQNANIRAYKIVDGNLVFDAEEDARLQEEYNNCGIAGEHILYDNPNGTTGNITLSDSAANYKYLEMYIATEDLKTHSYQKVCSPNGKTVGLYINNTSVAGYFTNYGDNITINGTSITRNRGAQYNIVVGNIVGDYGHSNPSQVSILRVVGLK